MTRMHGTTTAGRTRDGKISVKQTILTSKFVCLFLVWTIKLLLDCNDIFPIERFGPVFVFGVSGTASVRYWSERYRQCSARPLS